MANVEKPNLSRADQIYTGKLLVMMAGGATKEISSFSSWLIAGSAAIYAVVVNSIDKLDGYLLIGNLSCSIKIFLAAVFLNVVQRLLGSVVAAAATASRESELIRAPDTLDATRVLAAIESTVWWPARYLVRSSYRKALAGDMLASPKLNVHLTQLQAWLLFTQVGLVVFAGWMLLP